MNNYFHLKHSNFINDFISDNEEHQLILDEKLFTSFISNYSNSLIFFIDLYSYKILFKLSIFLFIIMLILF